MRNGLSNIRLQEMCSILTYDNSQIIICFAKLISFYFYLFVIALRIDRVLLVMNIF